MMLEDSNQIHTYVRKPSTGQPVGVMVAIGVNVEVEPMAGTGTDHVSVYAIGVSRCKRGEKFNAVEGIKIARARAEKMLIKGRQTQIPSIERSKQYLRFVKRSGKYFKRAGQIT
tara:strand:+ start:89 stop:430 length:342 start_codon:yes stop_codon:yes gene_type:complete